MPKISCNSRPGEENQRGEKKYPLRLKTRMHYLKKVGGGHYNMICSADFLFLDVFCTGEIILTGK